VSQEDDGDCSGNDTEAEKLVTKHSIAASSGRSQKKRKLDRKKELEDDEWSLAVMEQKVHCKGCQKWIKLCKVYELKDWEMHKKKCPQITGEETVRVRAVLRRTAQAVSIWINNIFEVWT
jgi:hypothetical protein